MTLSQLCSLFESDVILSAAKQQIDGLSHYYTLAFFVGAQRPLKKLWMNAVEHHKAQTQPWVNATKCHWAPIVAVAILKFWNVQNFRRRAPVKYLSVMERGRVSSIVLDCR